MLTRNTIVWDPDKAICEQMAAESACGASNSHPASENMPAFMCKSILSFYFVVISVYRLVSCRW